MSEKIKNNLENLVSRVMREIKQENVSMHSRVYFLFRTSLWVLATLFVFVATLYFVSLIAFIISGNALGSLTFFGMRGFVVMLNSLPWLLILVVATLVLLLEFLGSHFRFMYKRPLIYSLLAFLTILMIGGTLLAQTTLHKRVFEFTKNNRLPIAGPLYHGYAMRHSNYMHIGTIESIEPNKIKLITRTGDKLILLIGVNTKQPPMITLKEGMDVMVIGKREGATIAAQGIRPLDWKRGRGKFKMK